MRKVLCLVVLVSLVVVGCSGSDPAAGSGGSAAGTSAGMGGISGTGGIGGAGGVGGTGGVGGAGGSGACIPGESFNAGTDPNRNMVTATQVCQRLAEIQCAAERCCCPSGNPRKYIDESACVSGQREICIAINTQAIAEDARSGFDSTALIGAFHEFERLASTCSLDIVNWGTSFDGFAGVIKGTVALGAECWTPVDLLMPEANPAGAVASCGNAAACQGAAIATTPWTCGPRLGPGGRCLADPSCQDALFCDEPPAPPGNLTLGTCTSRRTDGSSCARATQCASLFCVGGQCVSPSVEAAYCLKP